MLQYDITMEHNEDSLIALSHMQYDLFCTRNFIARNLLSLPHGEEADRGHQGIGKRLSLLPLLLHRQGDRDYLSSGKAG